MKQAFISFILIFLFFYIKLEAQESKTLYKKDDNGKMRLTIEGASHFAGLALKCIHQEYPNKPGEVLADSGDLKSPKEMHPAFYGCYDWHSSVHGHWMLVRLLKLFPYLPEKAKIRKAISQNLTEANILAERAYFEKPYNKSFERTYGWAWLLKLSEELYTWDDEEGKKWLKNLQPLVDIITDRYQDFLPLQTYPIRTGVHPNTAFGLSFALDYAKTTNHSRLKNLIVDISLKYYLNDERCPADWEPNGSDFFSPCLLEAELMRKVLEKEKYTTWIGLVLQANQMRKLLTPAIVSDRTDPQIVHLDGLNLSRAWCMLSIATGLKEDNRWREIFTETAHKHIEATLPHIASGDYAGEHWLASFAVYALSIQ